MDSGNSGSMQSSSGGGGGGGDEEYDSTFFFSSAAVPSHILPSVPPFSHTHQQPQLSSYLDSFLDSYPRSPPPQAPPQQDPIPPLLHIDVSSRSPQTCTTSDLAALIACSNNPTALRPAGRPGLQASQPPPSSSADQLPPSTAAPTQQPRASKKRPRASRRAPTTVLTTDTTNFRQMVQEFTGIPAPPFSTSAFPRPRFDLFSAAASSAIRSVPPETSFLLRPFAQKAPVPSFNPFVSSSSSPSTALGGPTRTSSNATETTTTVCDTPAVCDNPSGGANPSPTISYPRLPPHPNLTMQQNPALTLQSTAAGQNFDSPTMPIYGLRVPPLQSPAVGEFAPNGVARRQASAQLNAGARGLFASEGVLPSRGGHDISSGGGGGGGDLP